MKYTSKLQESIVKGVYYPDEKEDGGKCLAYNWNFVKWFNLYCGSIVYDERDEESQNCNYHTEKECFNFQ